MPVEPFTLNSLSSTDRRDAMRIAKISVSAVMKALIRRAKPTAFRSSRETTLLEHQVTSVVASLDQEVFESLRPSLEFIAANNDLAETFVPTNLHVGEIQPLPDGAARPAVDRITLGRAPQAGPSRYQNLHVNLRALHCIDEANWGGFEYNRRMYLTSTWIGASGNIDHHDAIPLGKDIDDGVYADFGISHLGKFSLSTTNTYPKTFYWNFILADSNAVEVRSIQRISGAVATAVQAVAISVGGASVAAIAAAVNVGVQGILESLIFERSWPAYGIQIRIYSDNEFGADGVENRHTGNITSFNGQYRIGYQLAFV